MDRKLIPPQIVLLIQFNAILIKILVGTCAKLQKLEVKFT